MRKHVVFVIDASRSMEKRDVQGKRGVGQRRVDAVLDACFGFIEDQLSNKYSSTRDRYSVVSFNDVATVQLRAKRIERKNLYQLRKNLEAKIVPTHGTSYSAGLSAAYGVAEGGLDDAGEQLVLIFLSDGRPRDMDARCRKQQQPEVWIRFMQDRFRRRLTFYCVGVGPEDFDLLQDLCDMVQGTFHHARLMTSGRNAAAAPAMEGRAETLSDAFGNISSAVSSMCAPGKIWIRKGLALEDVEEAEWNTTDQKEVFCDKLSLEGDRLVVQLRDLMARVRDRPFASGGMRDCFRMWDLGPYGSAQQPTDLVGKQSKFVLSKTDELKGLKHDLRCHTLARKEAVLFNLYIKHFAASDVTKNVAYAALRKHPSGLKVLECDVYRLEDASQASGFRYLLVEPFLDGKYVKYNGNNGYVGKIAGLDNDQKCWWLVAQAFSHFTHHRSGGNLLVCDVQGVDQHITDPAIHSKLKQYGVGDRGVRGMRDFLAGHSCNAICRHLNLPVPVVDEATNGVNNASEPAQTGLVYPSRVHGDAVNPYLGRPPFTVGIPLCDIVYEEEEEDEWEYDEDDFAL